MEAKKVKKKFEEVVEQLNESFRLYSFYDEENDFGSFFVNELNPQKVEELLNEYRNSEDGMYDIEGFSEFLEEKGYVVIDVDFEPDFRIYF